jgi:hypothetical protein
MTLGMVECRLLGDTWMWLKVENVPSVRHWQLDDREKYRTMKMNPYQGMLKWDGCFWGIMLMLFTSIRGSGGKWKRQPCYITPSKWRQHELTPARWSCLIEACEKLGTWKKKREWGCFIVQRYVLSLHAYSLWPYKMVAYSQWILMYFGTQCEKFMPDRKWVHFVLYHVLIIKNKAL